MPRRPYRPAAPQDIPVGLAVAVVDLGLETRGAMSQGGNSMTRLVHACLLAVLVTALTVSGVAAAHVETFHDRFDNTFDATICDVDLTIHEAGRINGNVMTDRHDHELFQVTAAYRATWTNADGDWISVSTYGTNAKDVSVVDEPDGGVTVTFAFNGVPLWFRDSSGATISKDVGRIVFADSFDADGNFVGRTTVAVAGPHPAADDDPTCQIVA